MWKGPPRRMDLGRVLGVGGSNEASVRAQEFNLWVPGKRETST